MDNLSNSDDYDLGYQPSPSSVDQNDQSTSETPGHSTMSGSPFAYSRTFSEISAFSEPIDDSSFSSERSPSPWPVAKSRSLTKLAMKPHKPPVDDHKLDDRESTDSGGLKLNSLTSAILFYFFRSKRQ
jgi:hypothetical protein